jgi:hypothetical protein
MKFLFVMLYSKPYNFHGTLIGCIYFRSSLRLSAASSSVAGLFVCPRPLRLSADISTSVGGHLYVCRRPSLRLSADICTSVGGHLHVCRRTSVRLSAACWAVCWLASFVMQFKMLCKLLSLCSCYGDCLHKYVFCFCCLIKIFSH